MQNDPPLLKTDLYPDWDILATWVATVETGSVTTAAKMLGISQATASQRLKLLEVKIGTAVLDRSTRPAKPTPIGDCLFQYAVQLLAQAGGMMENLNNQSSSVRHIVRLGCVASFAATLGSALVSGLSGTSRQITLWSGLTPSLDEQLENRLLDAAITTSAVSTRPAIRKTELFSENYLIVFPAQIDPEDAVSIQELSRQLPFIRYSTRSVLGRSIDNYLESAGIMLERNFEFDSSEPLLGLVAAGQGFTITTPLCLWQARHFLPQLRVQLQSEISELKQKDTAASKRTFYLSSRDDEQGSLPQEAQAIILKAVSKLYTREISPALQLPAQSLWYKIE